jgi:hypothetical protein
MSVASSGSYAYPGDDAADAGSSAGSDLSPSAALPLFLEQPPTHDDPFQTSPGVYSFDSCAL